jgi:hypothetical protein
MLLILSIFLAVYTTFLVVGHMYRKHNVHCLLITVWSASITYIVWYYAIRGH